MSKKALSVGATASGPLQAHTFSNSLNEASKLSHSQPEAHHSKVGYSVSESAAPQLVEKQVEQDEKYRRSSG